ncbi:MAG: sugar ABC transporter ATP-binding protein [Synergistaceae bacterium]|jgi:ribose transport system ATP-binding protein|nr:sugar ABC transporter ATP-binding protein [Synergistaceae bacterium]
MDGSVAPLLKISHLSKSFTATRAVDDVSIDFYQGEIHALLGENGAGKSTLIKILSGVYSCREGSLIYRGENIGLDVKKLSLAVIHQDLGLADRMSVGENIAAITGYVKKGLFIDWKKTNQRARELMERMELHIDPSTQMTMLSAAEHSLVAIARALARKAEILILDEPTATLPQRDVEKLFELLFHLRRQGIAIIYITHRLDEVFEISQRITVLRNGKVVSSSIAEDTTPKKLILDIIGRDSSEVFVKASYKQDQVIALEVQELNTGFVGPVSFHLHKGEVLALYGLRGAGHHEVGRCIWGDVHLDSGKIILQGEEVKIKNPAAGIKNRLGFVSSKRHEEGLAAGYSVRENMYINPIVTLKGKKLISQKDEIIRCDAAIDKYAIKTISGEAAIGTLSGGNQQKVMIARWFEADCDVLILEEPTIGVDIGAKAEIYDTMKSGLEQGEAIILISSDVEEVSRIAHRVIVFDKGTVVKEVKGAEVEINYLTALATGVADH